MMTLLRGGFQAVVPLLLLLPTASVAQAGGSPAGVPPPSAQRHNDTHQHERSELLAMPKMPLVTLFGSDAIWKDLGGAPELVPGTWLEYENRSEHKNPEQVRFSVVPQPNLPSPEHRVIEYRVIEPTGDRNYIKMRLAPGKGMDRNVEAMLVKQANLPPLTFPVSQDTDAPANAAEVEAAQRKPKVTELGTESVTTPAGTFECRHIRVAYVDDNEGKQTLELWLDTSGKVPFWRIVKGKKAGQTMFLLGSGHDARSDLPSL